VDKSGVVNLNVGVAPQNNPPALFVALVVSLVSFAGSDSRHSWAFGNAHTTPDALRRMNRTDIANIPLPRVLTGRRNIVELKRPNHQVIRWAKSWFWLADTSMAIGQCREYIDNLHEDASSGLCGWRDIVAYRPWATMAVGRLGPGDVPGTGRVDSDAQRDNGNDVRPVARPGGEELLRVLNEQQAEEPAEPESRTRDVDPDDISF
jgi:hypothetical protein